MNTIQMVDLTTQYQRLKEKLDEAVRKVLESGCYVKGPQVTDFEDQLARYLGVGYVISCANGTDALTAALMSLDLKPGDEVITSAFSFIAPAEAIAFLRLKPVFADIDLRTFNIDPLSVREKITPKTRAIIPVHLFGQACNMEEIMAIAREHNLFVIEDNAQSLGSTQNNGARTGTSGHIGCTSFFPSKNLGCMGDGGAIFTNDTALAARIRRILRHGSDKQYHHCEIGINSRLDTIQAAILQVKLHELNDFNARRQKAAAYYSNHLMGIENLVTPTRGEESDHIFHQYTLRIKNEKRNMLQQHLLQNGIPSMVYYPIPLHRQKVFEDIKTTNTPLPKAEIAANEVLSIPMHTELMQDQMDYIITTVKNFYSCYI